MSSEKALALVLRTIDFSETSSVVTLFSREFGKLHALAKGSRRPKGPFESALDLLALCRIVFLAKSSDALDLLTEAKLERRFRAPARNLSRLYAGYYVAELLNELTHDRDPHPELFDAASDTLQALGAGAGSTAALVMRFELAALRVLGHLPSLTECVECGVTVRGEGRIAFGMLAGGVLCARCRPGKKQVISLSAAAWRTLVRLAEEAATNPPGESIERPVAGELRGVLSQYLCNLVGRKLRMHSYLANVTD